MEETHDSSEIRDTDIVFDCPYCGKSLAIDCRGAGLTIQCTDCGRQVQVPIPANMEITDLDVSDSDLEALVMNLRHALADAENRIADMSGRIDALEQRREFLEESQLSHMNRFGMVLESAARIREAVSEIEKALRLAAADMESAGAETGGAEDVGVNSPGEDPTVSG
ncbi:MAG: hypothetical protein FJ224_12785 [Lentisphaerae bacterium]|nr:hypothetical protein [Lentisphaerota bacterium]